jgi:hypothetical protein
MNWAVFAKAFFSMVIPLVVIIAAGAGFLLVWVKLKVKGKILAFFLENKVVVGRLLKEDKEHNCLWLGSDEDKEQYILEERKMKTSWWPSGFPPAFQEQVRVHWYVRNVPTPFDPEAHTSNISAKSLRMISDEAMLKQTWKDVREATGARVGAKGMGILPLMLIITAVALSAGNLILSLQGQTMLKALIKLFGGGS